MVAAGYNPLGAVRLQQKLTQLAGGDDKFSLFRTHPPSKERAADLQALVQKLPGAQALTGQPIVARFAVKPTSSILSPRKTIEKSGAETEILTKGRHDPCVGIRAVPVGEAMMAIVLADQALRHRGQVG